MLASILKKSRTVVSIYLVAFLVVGTAVVSFYNRIVMSNTLPIREKTEKITGISQYIFIHSLSDLDKSLRAYIITKDKVHLGYIQNTIKNHSPSFDTLTFYLNKQKQENPAETASIDSLLTDLKVVKDTMDEYINLTLGIIDWIDKDSVEIAVKFVKEDRGLKPFLIWNKFHARLGNFENKLNTQAQASYSRAINGNTWLQVILLVTGLPTLGWIVFKIRNDEKSRQKLIAEMADNSQEYVFNSGEKQENTDAKLVFEHSIANFRKASEFVRQITQGNYEVKWEGLNAENQVLNYQTLAGELMGMKEKMIQVKQQDDRRNWTNEGLSKLGEILRRESDINLIAEKILTEIIKYIHANQGMLFLVNNNDEKNQFLELKSAYAFNRKKYIGKQIKPGEGLAGQVWLEKEIIYLKEIPDDYVQIRSGLGGANPNNILVIPLKNDQSVQGVLEIASFYTFEPHQIAFVEKIAESIAITFANAQVAERTRKLLEETTQMTEQMRSQEEEMRQNMEELQATQEEMYRSQRGIAERELTLTALFDHTDSAVVALNTQLKVLAFNKRMKQLYNETGIRVEVNIDVRKVLTTEQFEYRKPRFERALAGEIFKDSYKTYSEKSGKTVYFEESYFPIRNEAGEITGFSIYSDDVTEEYLLRQDIEQKQANLDAVINNTDAAIISIGKDYKVLAVNIQMKKLYERAGSVFNIGDNVLEKLPEKEVKYRKKQYDRAFAGEKFTLIEEVISPLTQETVYYEISHFPIVDENYDVTGVSIFAKNVTKDILLKQELQQKQATMQAIINNTDDNILAIDKNYKVILVNEGYQKRYAEMGIDYKEGMSVFEILEKSIQEEWKSYYDRALTGEKFRLEKSFENNGKTIIREYFFNPIYNEQQEVIGMSLYNRLLK